MLGWVLTEALRRAGSPHRDLRTLLAERLFKLLGLSDSAWEIGYGQTYEIEGLPLVATWGGGNFTAEALGLIGQLLLNRGQWNGRTLIKPEAVDMVTTEAGGPRPDRGADHALPCCGLGFWVNSMKGGSWHSLPPDAFAGAGAGHQIVLVLPKLDMVVVRQGDGMGGDMSCQSRDSAGGGVPYWEAFDALLFKPLIAAVRPPVPPSPVIRDIRWAPLGSIVRHGYHCDLWPMTWADDDWLYTAWGDGNGFEPHIEVRCSMGLGRVQGHPPTLVCENVRSADAEDRGDGRRGRKASGMLMVDGVLYMLRRNADQDGRMTQLCWSTDHGKQWVFADWMFERFGAATFLNFGKNYAGARDGYVYVYAHDRDTAYLPADRMILMRVPKDRLRDEGAYEYFVDRNGDGSARWSADIEQRGAVFTHPKSCMRGGVSYNAGLQRYIWWQQLPRSLDSASDTRFHGGMGVYDAPEPWGPWTCAYFREYWDIGGGESGNFPTKWMSDDGRQAYLVFSGNDYMSVRGAEFVLH
jgi:hypothetical protein